MDDMAIDVPPQPVMALGERATEDRRRHDLRSDPARPEHELLVHLRSPRGGFVVANDPCLEKLAEWVFLLAIGGRLARDGRGECVKRSGGRICHGTANRPGEDAPGLPRENGRQSRVLGRSITRLAGLGESDRPRDQGDPKPESLGGIVCGG
jgi:hypothetical protein